MQLRRATIRNFRSIKDLSIDLRRHTAIIGGNGCGKSSILRAIDRFYSPSSTAEVDDFFNRDTTKSIEIELTFSDFSEVEKKLFESRIAQDQMVVTRVFDHGGRGSGRYYGSTLKHAAFERVRQTEGANPRRLAYEALRTSSEIYSSLQSVTRADQIPGQLAAWEAANPSHLTMGRDDGQFFGFQNVGRGALQKATSFVFIPAVRDASADAVDAKGAVIARLMELVVRSAILKRDEIREWRDETSRQYKALVDPAALPELGGLASSLSETLRLFYRDAGVDLNWRAADDFAIPLPTADVSLDDDGFAGPVDRKGHGLQRAFILSLLQHLAVASTMNSIDAAVESQTGNEALSPDQELAIEAISQRPGLILAIEEPELYQHPTKQRHFAKVLSRLSQGGITGVASETQVLFASHSSLFVSVDEFDSIRVARRTACADGGPKECVVDASSLATVAEALEKAHDKPAGTFTAEGLRARLHILGPELAEGFFADCVVIVEGPGDRAAIMAAASLDEIDLEALGVAVLPAGGKTNIDRPAAIFRSLGIPVYAIWDCDKGAPDKNPECTQVIPRLFNSEPPTSAATTASQLWACFHDKLETTLREEIGAGEFDKVLADVKAESGIASGRDAMKSPFIVNQVIKRAGAAGFKSQTLAEMVSKISALANKATAAAVAAAGS